MSTTYQPKLNISQIENKLPTPFLKDVNYTDYNGEIKTIKGFLGSVKNIEAINENDNCLQPIQFEDGSFKNPQMSLSTFFVDKNNVVFGDFFHGTMHAKHKQLFAIPQTEIQPLFHKKQDLQFDIVRYPIIEKSGENNKIAIKAKQMVGENYNIVENNTQINDNYLNTNGYKKKLKCFSPGDNVLDIVYNKYLKFNLKVAIASAYKLQNYNSLVDQIWYQNFTNKYTHVSDWDPKDVISNNQHKFFFNEQIPFQVYHDELLAVPKDKDYKTHFDCEIVSKTPNDITSLKQILMTQAKCGYPYVIIYDYEMNPDTRKSAKPEKLQYKLMSDYISYIKDKNKKGIEIFEKAPDFMQYKQLYTQFIGEYKQMIKDIEQDPDIQQFLKYEKQQIDYIISTKSKSFNCSNKLLKQCMQKIAKTDNKAEQLNYLINYESEIKKEVLESEKRRKINQYYQGQLNIVNRRQQHCDSIKAAKKRYADKAIEACHNKKQVKNTKTIKQSNMRKI